MSDVKVRPEISNLNVFEETATKRAKKIRLL